MAKLTWVTNVSFWYEYELTDEELQMYKEDEDAFFENVDVFGCAEIVREKEIPGDVELKDYDDDSSDQDYDDEDDYDED
jgi:hypothetical protein